MSEFDPTSWDGDGWTNETDEVPEGHPVPKLWRVLICPVRPKQKTASGLVIAQSAQDAQKVLNYVGKVVALGPLAYADERFKGVTPPKIGDWVAYGRYAGMPMTYKGCRLLLVNDDEILCDVPDPEGLTAHY